MKQEERARKKLEAEKKSSENYGRLCDLILGKNEKKQENKPVYIYQCVKCRKKFKTTNPYMRHCGILTQWIKGVEGIGIENTPFHNATKEKLAEERKRLQADSTEQVKVMVSGYITMSRENLNRILDYNDPVQGLCYSFSMSYCDKSNIEFSYEE